MSPHSTTEAERVSPPTRIQFKPPQTESICLRAAGGAAAGYFHLFMFSPLLKMYRSNMCLGVILARWVRQPKAPSHGGCTCRSEPGSPAGFFLWSLSSLGVT